MAPAKADGWGRESINFERDVSDGVFLARSPLTLEDIAPEYESLVERHTARNGFRTYDLLHVASARTMGCGKFLTFDDKARRLARLAGLRTN